MVAATAAILVAACGDDGSDGGHGEDYTIGVDLSLARDPFFGSRPEGLEDEADELGVTATLTDSDYDPGKQIANIQDFVTQNVDGILASPADVEAAIPAFEAAQGADIPIMSIADHTDPEVETSFIGDRWQEFGSQIAEWTCDHAEAKGEIALIKGPAGVSFVEEMEDGYKQYIEEECPGMSIAFEANVNTAREDAAKAAQDALTANPNLVAIFNNVDEQAAGTIQALREEGKLGDVLVTGFNGDQVGFGLLQDGTLDMTVALKPYQWGRLGMQTMVDYLNGEDVPALVEIDSLLLDQDNIDEVNFDEIR
jgi:ribose transport system substrate-binding protein